MLQILDWGVIRGTFYQIGGEITTNKIQEYNENKLFFNTFWLQ